MNLLPLMITVAQSTETHSAIYAERDPMGWLMPLGQARIGRTEHENGGIIDDLRYVCTLDQLADFVQEWIDGGEYDYDSVEIACQMFVSSINSDTIAQQTADILN